MKLTSLTRILKESCKLISHVTIDIDISNKIFISQIQQLIKSIKPHNQLGFVLGMLS